MSITMMTNLMNSSTILFCTAVISLSGNTSAIVIRHDLPDARYLIAHSDYPWVIKVGNAHGVLISPQWIITAAHVADGIEPFLQQITIGNRDYSIARVVLHPSWMGYYPPGFAEPHWVDMALIQLTEAVRGIVPVCLYEGNDEVGQMVTFVGSGRTGTGLTGPTTDDGQFRAATNRIRQSDDIFLYFPFDAPPNGTDLEGVSGPGDSGGPALIKRDHEILLAGVSSRNDHDGGGIGFYGTTDVYSRVSTRLDWIRSTLAGKGDVGKAWDLSKRDWPDTPVSRAAQSFFAAINSLDYDQMLGFEKSFLDPSALHQIPAESRAKQWVRLRRNSGPLIPVRFTEINPNHLIVLVSSDNRWRSFNYFMVEEADPRIRTILVGRSAKEPILRDSIRDLRNDIRAIDSSVIVSDDYVSLSTRLTRQLESVSDRGQEVSLLSLAATLCQTGPPDLTSSLFKNSISRLTALAKDSARARRIMTTRMLPPLDLIDPHQHEKFVHEFETIIESLQEQDQSPEIAADLGYLPLKVRIEANRGLNCAWLDERERISTIERLKEFNTQYGHLASPLGAPYARLVALAIDELENLYLGAPLPDVDLRDIKGNSIDLEGFSGQVLLLVCWTTWCAPCMAAVPHERELVERLKDEPFMFIGVNSDSTPAMARQTAAAKNMPWLNIYSPSNKNPQELVSRLHVQGWPSAFILDQQGRIRFKFIGSAYRAAWSTDDVERAVRSLLDEGEFNENINPDKPLSRIHNPIQTNGE